MNDIQPRQPKGIPVGGQFASRQRHEVKVDIALAAAYTDSRIQAAGEPHDILDRLYGDEKRRQTLAAGGYVEPSFVHAAVMPDTTEQIDSWWAQAYTAMGTAQDSWGVLPQVLPSGRRYPRMKYTAADMTLRMPALGRIKREARAQGLPIPVPFSAVDSRGLPIQGVALVTDAGNGRWIVEPRGMGGESAAKIAEAITSQLEGRAVARSDSDTGDLLEAHRRRRLAQGLDVRDSHSKWIEGFAHDADEGVLVMRTNTGKTYGYSVDSSTAVAVMTDYSPGRAFNHLIKGKTPRLEVETCSRCARAYATVNASKHACPQDKVARDRTLSQEQVIEVVNASRTRQAAAATVVAHMDQVLAARREGRDPKALTRVPRRRKVAAAA